MKIKRNLFLCLIVLMPLFSCAQQAIVNRSQLSTLGDDNLNKQNETLGQFLKTLKVPIKIIGYSYQSGGESASTRLMVLYFDAPSDYNKLRRDKIWPAQIYLYFPDDEQTRKAFEGLPKRGSRIQGADIERILKQLGSTHPYIKAMGDRNEK